MRISGVIIHRFTAYIYNAIYILTIHVTYIYKLSKKVVFFEIISWRKSWSKNGSIFFYRKSVFAAPLSRTICCADFFKSMSKIRRCWKTAKPPFNVCYLAKIGNQKIQIRRNKFLMDELKRYFGSVVGTGLIEASLNTKMVYLRDTVIFKL